jgi:hypothetical protein
MKTARRISSDATGGAPAIIHRRRQPRRVIAISVPVMVAINRPIAQTPAPRIPSAYGLRTERRGGDLQVVGIFRLEARHVSPSGPGWLGEEALSH